MVNTQLLEKWESVLDHPEAPQITSDYKKRVTAIMLENTQQELRKSREVLSEAVPTSSTANVANYDPVLIGLVRRAMPKLIAYDVCAVQPMTMPTGLVFAIRSRYTDKNGNEALYNEADSKFSAGSSGQAGTNPVDSTTGLDPWGASPGFDKGEGVSTAEGEDFGGATTLNSMSFTIEKSTVTAKERALKAEYTVELQQDLKAVHGLDAEGELSNILSSEIVSEINREVIRSIYKIAKIGCEPGQTAVAGTFNLDVDSNGRWSVERFKGLMFQIEREANRIAQTTRRGRGNVIICSADVASALAMAGKLDVGQLGQKESLDVDDTGNTFVGTLNGKYKVYVDPYMANGAADQFVLVGYRGTSSWDAGLFYAPYVPLQMYRAIDPSTFQPKIAFKTRYGMCGHPLNGNPSQSADSFGLVSQSSFYYRMFKVSNLS